MSALGSSSSDEFGLGSTNFGHWATNPLPGGIGTDLGASMDMLAIDEDMAGPDDLGASGFGIKMGGFGASQSLLVGSSDSEMDGSSEKGRARVSPFHASGHAPPQKINKGKTPQTWGTMSESSDDDLGLSVSLGGSMVFERGANGLMMNADPLPGQMREEVPELGGSIQLDGQLTSPTKELSQMKINDRDIGIADVARRLNDSRVVSEEYDDLEKKNDEYMNTKPKTIAEQEANRKFNRYSNIIPYDETIVTLDDVEGQSSYINANYIPMVAQPCIMGDSSLGRVIGNKEYFIATQGPLNRTLDHFWRMIYAERVPVITFLGKEIEKQVSKVEKYWPFCLSRPEPFDTMMVVLDKEEKMDPSGCIMGRALRVYPKNINPETQPDMVHVVYQFQYTAWPDHGVPQTTRFIRMLFHAVINTEYNLSQKQYGLSQELTEAPSNLAVEYFKNKLSTPPVFRVPEPGRNLPFAETPKRYGPNVVHCSAGVGRTGTFICCYQILLRAYISFKCRDYSMLADAGRKKQLKDAFKFNLYDITDKIRQARPYMIQKSEQYEFCYKVIQEEFEQMALVAGANFGGIALTSKRSLAMMAPIPKEEKESQIMAALQKDQMPRRSDAEQKVVPLSFHEMNVDKMFEMYGDVEPPTSMLMDSDSDSEGGEDDNYMLAFEAPIGMFKGGLVKAYCKSGPC